MRSGFFSYDQRKYVFIICVSFLEHVIIVGLDEFCNDVIAGLIDKVHVQHFLDSSRHICCLFQRFCSSLSSIVEIQLTDASAISQKQVRQFSVAMNLHKHHINNTNQHNIHVYKRTSLLIFSPECAPSAGDVVS